MSTAEHLRGRRVLLVEDVAALRMLCAARLERAGAFVATAEGLEQARELIRSSGPFDVACIDLSLPDGDGARLVAELTPVPCVAFTAHDDAAQRAARHGFVDRIDKIGGDDPSEVLGRAIRRTRTAPRSISVRPRRLSDESPEQLKARYVRFLSEQRAALRSAFRADGGLAGAQSVETTIHRIKGTAVHFELPEVSAAAAALSSALRRADRDSISALWLRLEDVMVSAIEHQHLNSPRSCGDHNAHEEIATCAS